MAPGLGASVGGGLPAGVVLRDCDRVRLSVGSGAAVKFRPPAGLPLLGRSGTGGGGILGTGGCSIDGARGGNGGGPGA
jgi:hypothetical protein